MNTELNESQLAAVQYCDGPSLVIAGAGSGKTRVLTYKIAYLLQQGMNPWNILALTFTNKAAREMQERISRQVGPELARPLWMGTFHSIFSRILRIECEHIGFSSDFTIYDATDSKSLVRSIIKEMGLDEKTYKPGVISNRISEAKNRLVWPGAYRKMPQVHQRDEAARIPCTGEIYERYMTRCRQSNAMDFDDLLLYTHRLLSEHPEVAQKYETRFQFVLVDEYQDTNYAQHQIVWLLTQHQQRVCVVGDDAQSIYSFRGANIDNILRFQDQYPSARMFKLEQNYRSTQTIVQAANSLIHHNRGQIYKEVFSRNSQGNRIRLLNMMSDLEEAATVARTIANLHGRDHMEYGDIAILYRTNNQSRSLEEALRKINIPYHIYGGLSFYQRKEIKDVIAYFRLAVNPHDEEALKRVINYPARGIGNTTLTRVFDQANGHEVSPFDIIQNPEAYQVPVQKAAAKRLQDFAQMILTFAEMAEQQDVVEVSRTIVRDSQLQATINQGHEPDDIARQENLQELMDGIVAFAEERLEQGLPCRMTDYLQDVSLLSDLDENSKPAAPNADVEGNVTLMTIHSAKGLEFKTVFVVGVEEGLLPNEMALNEGARGLEEERRLMYVAMTRAEEKLYLTTARCRFRFGQSEITQPSRFLREIDPSLLDAGASSASSRPASTSLDGIATRSPFGSRRFGSTEASAVKTPVAPPPPTRLRRLSSVTSNQHSVPQSGPAAGAPALSVGNVIEHARFGRGQVMEVTGNGIDAKATIRFDNVGTKQLLLRFAKFTVVK